MNGQDKLSGTVKQRDHDLLIEISVKMTQLSSDFKDLRDGMKAQLTDHEGRMLIVERLLQKVDPNTLIPRFDILEQDFHDQQLKAKDRVKLAAVTATVVTSILNVAILVIALITGLLRLGAK